MKLKSKSDIVRNKKATYTYELFDRYEAGLVLSGSQAKSICCSKGNIQDSYVVIWNGEAFLKNAYIPPCDSANIFSASVDPYKDVKLLLNKKEIRSLYKKLSEKGFTIIPIRIYKNDRGKLKCEIAIAKGKRLYDKRVAIKNRELDKEKNQY